MKKIIILAISLLASSFAYANGPDITGKYHCQGTDPFAKENYQASLNVTKTDQTFQFLWDLGQFGKYKGTGFYADGIDNLIAITVASLNKQADPQNPYNSEIQVYKIEKDGSLAGRWTFLGKSKLSPIETCVKQYH